MMNINRHKLPLYQKGLRAMSMLKNLWFWIVKIFLTYYKKLFNISYKFFLQVSLLKNKSTCLPVEKEKPQSGFSFSNMIIFSFFYHFWDNFLAFVVAYIPCCDCFSLLLSPLERGLYRSKSGLINADVNGALSRLQYLKKRIPRCF